MKPKTALADAILIADVHLREDTPICRTDDYAVAQAEKLRAIRALQRENGDCPVLCAGDVYHHWRPSPALLTLAIAEIRDWWAVPGQHDLPQHDWDRLRESGFQTLVQAGVVLHLQGEHRVPICAGSGQTPWDLYGAGYGAEIPPVEGPGQALASRRQAADRGAPGVPVPPRRRVLVLHRMMYRAGAAPYLGAPLEAEASHFLRSKAAAPFDLIVSGDNHQAFVLEHEGRVLVNCGSMMRMTAAQVEHRPAVYLWWANDNHVEPVLLPAAPGVVSREHLAENAERDERVAAFVKRLKEDCEIGLSFEDNLERYMKVNKVPVAVQQIVWQAVGRAG